MVLNVDVHPSDIVLDAAASPVFNGIDLAVNDQHRAKWIVAAHRHHAGRHALAACGDAIRVIAAAFGAGAIMCYIHFSCVERRAKTIDAAAGGGAVIDPIGAAIVFHIAGRIEHNAAGRGGAVYPLSLSIRS